MSLWVVAGVVGVAVVAVVVEISGAGCCVVDVAVPFPRWICEKIFPLAPVWQLWLLSVSSAKTGEGQDQECKGGARNIRGRVRSCPQPGTP